MTTLDAAAVVDAVKAAPPDRSWLDGALERGERQQRVHVDWRRFFLAVLLALPLAVGWTAGTVVRLAVFAWAAACEGYARGRAEGPTPDESQHR
jgi:hypothetical protein